MAIPSQMQSDWSSYFKNTQAGNSMDWAGGKLARTANGANYSFGDKSYDVNEGTDLNWLAQQSPELAKGWQQNYGFQVDQGAVPAWQKPSGQNWAVLTDHDGTRFDAGSIDAAGKGMQIRPDFNMQAQQQMDNPAGFGALGTGPTAPGTAMKQMPQAMGPAGAQTPPDLATTIRGLGPLDSTQATGQLKDVMSKNNWTADQVGQSLGFSGQQITDHIARYGAPAGDTLAQQTSPISQEVQALGPLDSPAAADKLSQLMTQKGWSPEQVGAALGFSGQQITDHLAKYSTSGQATRKLQSSYGNLVGGDGKLNLEAAKAQAGPEGGGLYFEPIYGAPDSTSFSSGAEGGSSNQGPVIGYRTIANPTLDSTFTQRDQLSNQPYDEWDLQGNRTGGGKLGEVKNASLKKEMILAAAMMVSAGVAGAALAGGTAATTAGGVGAAGGSDLAGGVLSKAALDGTTAFGANSVAGAYDLAGITSAGSGGLDFASGFTDGGTAGGALDTGYTSATAGIPFTGAPQVPGGPDFSKGFTDSGTSGGPMDPQYAPTNTTPYTGTPNVPNVPTNGAPGSGVPKPGGVPTVPGGSANSSGTGGLDLNSLMGLVNGIYSAQQQKANSRDMLDWMNGQMASIDKLYAPGSPEHEQMKQEMERKDAAAGRNSQYGTRAVDLAARVTTEKARQKAIMANAMQGNFKDAFAMDNNAYAGLFANIAKGGGVDGIVKNIGSLINTVTDWFD